MIKLSNVSKYYNKNICALKEINFSIDKGERVAIVGENGAGKSTLFKLLTGILHPSIGDIQINNVSLERELLSLRKCIGYLPENAPLLLELTPQSYLENLASLYGIDHIGSTEKVKVACQLQNVWQRKIFTLSKGFRQRVALAAAVIHDPEILILDEPTVGLDPLQIQQFRQMILKMSDNKILLFSTHVLSEVENICDRCLYLESGALKSDVKIGEQSDFWKICYKGTWPIEIAIVNVDEKSLSVDEWQVKIIDTKYPEKIISKICELGLEVRSVEPVKGNLESLFS